MNLNVPLEIVETAEGKLAQAESDLTSTINKTKAQAIQGVAGAIDGHINTACTELIEMWNKEVNQVTAILSDFKAQLAATRGRVSESSAEQARSIAGIDVHAARLG